MLYSASPQPVMRKWCRGFARSLRRTFLRPQMIAFLPALMLGGYWFGGQGILMIIALTFPLLLVLGGMFESDPTPVDSLTGLMTGEALGEAADDALFSIRSEAEAAIMIAVEIDEGAELEARLGGAGMEAVLCRTSDRILGATRAGDRIARLGPYRFGILLSPVRNAGMDLALRAVERMQGAVSEPISVDATSIYITISAGFCLERRAPRRSGLAMLQAAEVALDEARVPGHGAVRAYSTDMRNRVAGRKALSEEIGRALEEGEILPWFQPQVATASGEVTGMEALARWQHPERGLIPPADFLPAAEGGGYMERLGEVMLFHGLAALRRWDKAGMSVPGMGINFSPAELRNPKLVDKVRWELDRFDIAPERLVVEVLETVVAETGDDTVTANVAGLAELGCRIDLDDFGTGAASIANIRRFGVSRIKIDRSFIARIDADPQQEKMVSAILSLAQKLEIDTLAEGVETMAEQRKLAELGCAHAQGFAFARPMPVDRAEDWVRHQATRLSDQGPSIAAG